MYIHEMTDEECRAALEKFNFGRLACARDNQPYVVPINFAYDGHHIYGFTTVGQKVEWMRSNPRVCLEIDEVVSHDRWMSVIVLGHYEELTDLSSPACAQAHEALQRRASWWEPAYVSDKHRGYEHSLAHVFYRILIQQMTGHRAEPDSPEAVSAGKVGARAVRNHRWRDLFHLGRAGN